MKKFLHFFCLVVLQQLPAQEYSNPGQINVMEATGYLEVVITNENLAYSPVIICALPEFNTVPAYTEPDDSTIVSSTSLPESQTLNEPKKLKYSVLNLPYSQENLEKVQANILELIKPDIQLNRRKRQRKYKENTLESRFKIKAEEMHLTRLYRGIDRIRLAMTNSGKPILKNGAFKSLSIQELNGVPSHLPDMSSKYANDPLHSLEIKVSDRMAGQDPTVFVEDNFYEDNRLYLIVNKESTTKNILNYT